MRLGNVDLHGPQGRLHNVPLPVQMVHHLLAEPFVVKPMVLDSRCSHNSRWHDLATRSAGSRNRYCADLCPAPPRHCIFHRGHRSDRRSRRVACGSRHVSDLGHSQNGLGSSLAAVALGAASLPRGPSCKSSLGQGSIAGVSGVVPVQCMLTSRRQGTAFRGGVRPHCGEIVSKMPLEGRSVSLSGCRRRKLRHLARRPVRPHRLRHPPLPRRVLLGGLCDWVWGVIREHAHLHASMCHCFGVLMPGCVWWRECTCVRGEEESQRGGRDAARLSLCFVAVPLSIQS